MLQAQQQGTGTTPLWHRGWQGIPSLSRGGMGRAAVGSGLWPARLGTPGAGGTPQGSVTPPPLRREGDGSDQAVDVTVNPLAKPPWVGAARTAPAARENVPAPSRGVLAIPPSEMESTGAQECLITFPQFSGEGVFCPYRTSCCLLVGESSFHTKPQTKRSMPLPSVTISRGLSLNILPAPRSGLALVGPAVTVLLLSWKWRGSVAAMLLSPTQPARIPPRTLGPHSRHHSPPLPSLSHRSRLCCPVGHQFLQESSSSRTIPWSAVIS